MEQKQKQSGPVAIVGGGLSGLFLAINLAQCGVQVEVFEKRLSQESSTGRELPIIVNQKGLQSLKTIGVNYKDFQEVFVPFHERIFWQVDGDQLTKVGELAYQEFDQSAFIRRIHLWHILFDETKKYDLIQVHVGKTYTDIDYDNAVLTFDDGSKKEFEFIFGCDGVYSKIRDHMIKQSGFQYLQIYDGTIGMAFELFEPLFKKKAMGLVMIKGQFAFIQVSNNGDDKFFGFLAFSAKEYEDSGLSMQDFLRKLLGDFFFEKLTFPDMSKISQVHERVSIYPWIHKKVMLLGDAANAQGPQAGLGLNVFLQAIVEFKGIIQEKGYDWKSLAYQIQEKYYQETFNAWKIVTQMKSDAQVQNREIARKRNMILAQLERKYSDRFVGFNRLVHNTFCPIPIIYEIQMKSIQVADEIQRLDNFMQLVMSPEQQKPIIDILEQYKELFDEGRKYHNERPPLKDAPQEKTN